MIFRIGDDIVLGGNSKYHLSAPLSGLTAPDIRTGDGLYAGVDGGYVSSQLYGFRTIVLQGFYIGDSCEEADQLRSDLMAKLHIRYLYPVFIKTFSGRNYFVEGYISDIKSDVTNPRSGEFQISILCPDPIIYDGGDGMTTDSSWVEVVFYKEQGGGFTIPYEVPVTWSSGQTTTVVNSGDVDAYPIITLKGKVHDAKIRNLTTGEFILLNTPAGETVATSDITIIDMKQRIITKNGLSIASWKDVDSTWWALIPGNNKVVLETSSSNDISSGSIKYKFGYRGI